MLINDTIAQAAGTIAAKWVTEGRYATVEEALEPAILACLRHVDRHMPQVAAAAVAEHTRREG